VTWVSSWVLLVGVILVAIPFVALVDVARRPDAQFSASGQRRTTWVVVLALSLVMPLFGLVAVPAYLIRARPRLDRESSAGTQRPPREAWWSDE
jgi:hypothetical protein